MNPVLHVSMYAAAALALGVALAAASVGGGDTAAARLTPGAVIDDAVPRFGLNLGGSGTWGAEQLRANVLVNPGFEPVLDRTLLIVREARGRRLVDDTAWLARPDGFWTGGRYDVRTGADAGRSGRILDSRKRADDGFAEVWLDRPTDGLAPGDVVSLTRDRDLEAAPRWWRGAGRVAASAETRPGSPGRRSVRLAAEPGQPAELLHYLDNIPDRAGKLLPVEGRWRLAFWARAGSAARLRIRFDRSGLPAFVDEWIALEDDWQFVEIDIDADDTGPAGPLTLGLTAHDGPVWLDDMYLGDADPGPGGFRRVVVDTLRRLQPGYLRDWQGQLGDTLDNRLADMYAHRPARYRPGEHEAQFHYGLPDFFALCGDVGANPWVVAPTTLSDAEWHDLGAWLRRAADTYGFDEVLVEFGNENWNPLFRPGGIADADSHAAAADRGFRLLRAGSGDDGRLRTVVNAQFVDPSSPAAIGAASTEADRVAVAPYFLYRLDADTPVQQGVRAAFAEDDRLVQREADMARAQGGRLAVYEVNLHTTLGDAPAALRNAVVAGAPSGPALARRLLQATLAGVREQAVYTFTGFDAYVDGSTDLVRLWGITRDLARPDRLRPTGLALDMLNRVAGGTTRASRCAGSACAALTAAWFDDGRAMAVVSAAAGTTRVSLGLDCEYANLALLDGSDAERNNEAAERVRIDSGRLACGPDGVVFELPAYSLAVVDPAPPPTR